MLAVAIDLFYLLGSSPLLFWQLKNEVCGPISPFIYVSTIIIKFVTSQSVKIREHPKNM